MEATLGLIAARCRIKSEQKRIWFYTENGGRLLVSSCVSKEEADCQAGHLFAAVGRFIDEQRADAERTAIKSFEDNNSLTDVRDTEMILDSKKARRELAANLFKSLILATIGRLACANDRGKFTEYAEAAVSAADILIAELAKEKK